MQFNRLADGARTLPEPFIPAPHRTSSVSLIAARAISSLTVGPRLQTETREWRIYTTRPGGVWEDRAFAVLQLTSIAGIVLALRVVLFL